jgi:signal transduction histidine kinase
MVLISGSVLSILIATTFWVGQVATSRARDLFSASLELREKRRDLQRAVDRSREQDERIAAVREERRALLNSMKAEIETLATSPSPDPAVSELETFTYSVSHDLRSPMGAILNYAAVLAEDFHDELGPEGGEYLARISSSARRAIAMMDGLLAFSRVGSQDLTIVEVDVARMVRDIHAELCQSWGEAKPALSMGELPSVRGDSTLLWTMLSNLLTNAFKFTRGVPEPLVEVGGYVQGTDVVFYVEDNGIGFDMRHASKLFGIFERLPSGEHHEGHGIGLAIVARIAHRHGGNVRAEGVPEKGATFFVTLPREPVTPGRDVVAEATKTS